MDGSTAICTSDFDELLRREDGSWILGFSGLISKDSILYVEMFALLQCLLLAKSIGMSSMLCALDSLKAVKLVSLGVPKFHKYAAIVTSIQDLLQEDWTLSFEHTFKEANMCVDYLVKFGV